MADHIEAGDILRRRKGLLGTHVGVALANDMVLHNTWENGEHVSGLAEFADDKRVEVEKPAAEERIGILYRAALIASNPRPYNVLSNNCEHTVTRCIEGEARSPQLRGVAAVLCVMLAFRVLSSKS